MTWDAYRPIPGFSEPDRRKPQPPSEISVISLETGGYKITFRDQGNNTYTRQGQELNRQASVAVWQLRVCHVQFAGTQQDPQFANKVFQLSTVINSIISSGRGDFLEFYITDEAVGDVWAILVGISTNGITGFPSEPQRLSKFTIPPGPLNNITSPSLNLVQVLDVYGNEFVELNPVYTAPLILGRFFGVLLFSTGTYINNLDYALGNVIYYEGRPPGQIQEGSVVVLDDPGVTTIYFVSVDRAGKHVDDITTAPSVALPGGIHV